MDLTRIARLWIEPARAGYARSQDWQNWARQLLQKENNPPSWLLAMVEAGTPRELTDVITGAVNSGLLEGNEDALLGYAWMLYEEKLASFEAAMETAATLADAYETTLPCESIYELIQEYNNVLDKSQVVNKAKGMFLPYRDIATRQWKELNDLLQKLT